MKIKCECGREFKNKGYLKRHIPHCLGKTYCLNCNILLIKRKYKFCSSKCCGEYKRKSLIEKWLNGDIDGSSKSGHASFVKHYLIDKYGNKCMKCGWNEKNPHTGKIPIEVDHIDGNHKNNKLSNIRLLCPNCHSLTKNYKALNWGSGRQYRKNAGVA